MQYGVPSDVDLADLDDIVEPRQLVFAIVSWASAQEVADEHTDENDDEHVHMMEMWFPAVLDPCKDGGWHGPAATYFGPMHVFSSERKAFVQAAKIIRRLRKQRTELERGLEGLTAEAAEVEAEH